MRDEPIPPLARNLSDDAQARQVAEGRT